MGMPVRIDENLYEAAKSEAKSEHRTIAGQLEFWATVGRAAIDNPDLPISFITASLASLAEPRAEGTQFIPRSKKV
jgi:hypothetical protein